MTAGGEDAITAKCCDSAQIIHQKTNTTQRCHNYYHMMRPSSNGNSRNKRLHLLPILSHPLSPQLQIQAHKMMHSLTVEQGAGVHSSILK